MIKIYTITSCTITFSDGGTEYPEDVLKKYRDDSKELTKHARIFSYAVGPHPLPIVALRKMACETHGSFSTITAMGAIRTKIQVIFSCKTTLSCPDWKKRQN